MQSRIIELIDKTTRSARRFKEIEALTGIASNSWQKVYAGKQRPTMEMIESLCKAYPSCALWLTTGETDLSPKQQLTIDELIIVKSVDLTILGKGYQYWRENELLLAKSIVAKCEWMTENWSAMQSKEFMQDNIRMYENSKEMFIYAS